MYGSTSMLCLKNEKVRNFGLDGIFALHSTFIKSSILYWASEMSIFFIFIKMISQIDIL